MNNLGNLYADIGDMEKTEDMYLRALYGYENARKGDALPALETMRNLGLLYRAQGRRGHTDAMFRRAWLGRERLLGPQHPDTLMAKAELEKLIAAG